MLIKIHKNRQKKEQIVAKLSEKARRAKGLVFTNYQGLTHVQLEKLKKALKQANAELVVTKNTLLKLALGKVAKEPKETKETQQGPTATLFLYADPIEPLKQLARTIKELKLPAVKFGIIDGKSLTGEQVLTLATLPAFDVLMAQLLFQMKAPLIGLHRALGWEIQRFVLTLKAIEKKGQSS